MLLPPTLRLNKSQAPLTFRPPLMLPVLMPALLLPLLLLQAPQVPVVYLLLVISMPHSVIWRTLSMRLLVLLVLPELPSIPPLPLVPLVPQVLLVLVVLLMSVV